MPAIPLGRTDYARADLPPLRLYNMFFETAPTNLEDQAALLPRPGLVEFAELGISPIRGILRQDGAFGGDMIVVAGDEVWRTPLSGFGAGYPGNVIGELDGSNRVSMAGNGDMVMIADGERAFATDGETVEQIEMPDEARVQAVAAINGYFLLAKTDTGTFYWTQPGSTEVDALDFATAENSADALEAVKVVGDEIWMLGRASIEVWAPTGDGDFPFQRVRGRLFGTGCVSRDTAVELGGALLFAGVDRVSGGLAIYRAGAGLERISDSAMAERLREAVIDPGSWRAWGWSIDGHSFYVLTLGEGGTFAYDLTTGMWSELGSYGQAYFRGHLGCSVRRGEMIAGDAFTGKLWKLDPGLSKDGDEPLVRRFSGWIDLSGGALRCDAVRLECSTGAASPAPPDDDPEITLSWSDDGGGSWSDPRPAGLGRAGERRKAVAWKALGLMRRPGRIFAWQVSDNVYLRALRAKFNEGVG